MKVRIREFGRTSEYEAVAFSIGRSLYSIYTEDNCLYTGDIRYLESITIELNDNGKDNSKKCPNCNNDLVMQEGCETCNNCYYSACSVS